MMDMEYFTKKQIPHLDKIIKEEPGQKEIPESDGASMSLNIDIKTENQYISEEIYSNDEIAFKRDKIIKTENWMTNPIVSFASQMPEVIINESDDCGRHHIPENNYRINDNVSLSQFPVLQDEENNEERLLEKLHQCEHCGVCFRLAGYLRKHKLRVHSGEKKFKCELCDKCFSENKSLKVHFRTHTGEKPFKCEECGREFSSRSNLRKHLRIHSGQKRFFCTECDKTFNERSHLKRHFRIHTGERPFKCDECGQDFNNRESLKRHIKIHTGEMPFECNFCSRKFRLYEPLKRHIRTVHGQAFAS